MILWLGGSCAAGKTTIARTLALRLDLGFYRIDARAYAHRDELIRCGLRQPDPASYDARWLEPGPEQLAERFIESSRQTFPLIVQDLAGADVVTVVEGPQLFPADVRTVAGARQALWLVSTEDFRRNALGARSGAAARFTSDAAAAAQKRIQRDNLLIERIRSEAGDFTVLEVDGSRDLESMTEAVRAHFAPVLDAGPRIVDGPVRASIRRAENDAMIRNVEAFLADLGASAPAEPGPLPFTCECERLGCEALVERTPREYGTIRPAAILAH